MQICIQEDDFIMENNIRRFLEGLKGKRIALCGIGGSNLPLIKLFAKYGAFVMACDRRDREALGENAGLAEEYGAELHLGENYLKDLNAETAQLLQAKWKCFLTFAHAEQLP